MNAPDLPVEGGTFYVFTDGAAKGNPGPSGWAAIVLSPDGQVKELGGGAREATNNQMELAGAIEGLKSVGEREGPVALYTDSTYVIRGITGWIFGWRRRGWKTASGDPVKNVGWWKALAAQVAEREKRGGLSWHYLRGHSGTPANERADRIAVGFAARFAPERASAPPLYEGPLIEYTIPLLDLPDDTSLPPERSDKDRVKKKAYCYLSVVGGQLERHATWAECEARVKGVKGARFKKAMSADEVPQICTSWGVAPPPSEG